MDDRTAAAVLALILKPKSEDQTQRGKIAANVILNDVFALISDKGWTVPEVVEGRPDFVENLTDIVYLRSLDCITTKHVKALILRAWDVVCLDLVAELRDSKLLEEAGADQIASVVATVISANQKIVDQILGGKINAVGSLIGKTMKELGGKGDPTIVKSAIMKQLGLV